MKLLADENIESYLVLWLRENGHDVLWAAEELSSMADEQLLDCAESSSRILLTNDLDFGELIFREHRYAHGIILLRLHAGNPMERMAYFQAVWSKIEENLPGNFLTVTQKQLRIRPIPLDRGF